MQCDEYLTQWEEQELDKAAASQEEMEAHVNSCAHCRAIVNQEKALTQALKSSSKGEPSPVFWQRLEGRIRQDEAALPAVADAHLPTRQEPTSAQPQNVYERESGVKPVATTAPSKRESVGPLPSDPFAEPMATKSRTRPLVSGPFFRQMKGMMSAAVAGVMLVLIGTFVWTSGEVRFKGEPPKSSLTLDLQVSVERWESSGRATMVRAEDGLRLGEQDGLVFRFGVKGGEQLLLIERDPGHQLRVLVSREHLESLSGYSTIEIANESGKALRYVPDGPPGEYTLFAILTQTPRTPTPQVLDQYWDLYVDQLLEPGAADESATVRLDGFKFEKADDGNMRAPGSADAKSGALP